jgi:hypothetical protein
MSHAITPVLGGLLACVFLVLCLASADCGSGACQQSPCVPGVPVLSGTCKCVATDGGPALEGGDL